MDEFETWWESPSGAYDRQHKFLAKAAWEAGREAGMREAAAIVGTLAERPYDTNPEFDAILHAESAILAAIEGKK